MDETFGSYPRERPLGRRRRSAPGDGGGPLIPHPGAARRERLLRFALFAPSALFGVLGGIWLLFQPLELEADAGPVVTLAVAAALVGALLGAAWLLERLLPSFRRASTMLERALIDLPITLPVAILLAAVTAVGEEVFFRGALLPILGVWGQALVFGLMHPAPRAWSYTVFTFVAGVLFGYATVLTGSLVAPIVAHFVVNLHGFLEVRRLRAVRDAARRTRAHGARVRFTPRLGEREGGEDADSQRLLREDDRATDAGASGDPRDAARREV